jgi:EmrB/QacA subfamily drug resistance transporter
MLQVKPLSGLRFAPEFEMQYESLRMNSVSTLCKLDDKTQRWSALLVASSSSFLTPFMLSAVNIALPAIGHHFKADAVLLSWVATSILVSAAVVLVPAGKLADIYGRKKVFMAGMLLFALASLLAGLAWSIEALIVFRMLQGLGIAMIFSTGIAIVTSVFPLAERGRVLGITVASVYCGLSCGPLAGGWLTQTFSWRSVFLIPAPFGMGLVLLTLWKLKGEWAPARGERFDLAGSFIYALAIVALMCGLSGLPDLWGWLLVLTGFGGLTAFGWWELRTPHPVFEVRLFSLNRVFAFSCLAALIHYAATFGVTFLMSLALQYIQNLSPYQAGLVLMAQPVMMAMFSPFAGKLSDRVEPRLLASTGMGITALALLLLTRFDAGTSLGSIIACLMILGFGFALFSSPNMNAIMSSVEKRYFGVASGSVATMRLLGQMISLGIVTLIFALLIGREPITPERHAAFLESVRWALLIFCGLCVCGVYFSFSRGKLRNGGSKAKSSIP